MLRKLALNFQWKKICDEHGSAWFLNVGTCRKQSCINLHK